MTSIGLEILNIFSRCLRDISSKRRTILSDRDVYIISMLYNWEEPIPNVEDVISSKLNITKVRVRQLSIRALRKVKRFVFDGFDPIASIMSIIDSYALPEEREYPGKTIARLCFWEMNSLPPTKMVRLLANLCLQKKSDIGDTIQYFNSHKRVFLSEYRKRQGLEIEKFRRNARFSQFLDSYVIWFGETRRWKREDFNDKIPKRIIKSNERYRSGIFFSNKTQREVQYESGAEYSFIQQLESSPRVIYYLEQPIRLEYNRNGKQYFYTPDFTVLLDDGRCFLVEIKGTFDDILDARLHRRMEKLIEYCEQHGLGILLNVRLRSFDYLASYPINTTLEKVIQDKLNEKGGRTIFLNEFRRILEQMGAKKTAALALILKNEWGYYPFPFKLTPRNPYTLFREKIIDRLLESLAK